MDARKDQAPVQTWVEADGSVNFEKPCNDKHNYKMAFLLSTIAVLLLSVAVSLSVYFSAAQKSILAELNLEEGESLTYRVDHDIQVQGSNVQNAAIRLLVGIVVHNKTSEEYWFLIKFNLSHVGGDVEIGSMKMLTEYFLVRLPLAARTSSNKTTCSFEVYGNPQTNTELIRLFYATLEQLFPSLKRELYENVDGQEATKSKPLYPEDSPLLPGSVKMHREANTSDENTLVIKNHFDRKNFIDMSPDIDLDLKYTDIALINKSNGMMSESHLNLSKQLNFGEEMRNNANLNINQRKITLTSHASRVEGFFWNTRSPRRLLFSCSRS
ncbi:uncharacterized protein [Montipora foliosa]|uniref:uncharacterized protein n=1 Tax=Montipora foliosa TaxID=591990 RepID=UPI0035F13418